MTFQVTPRPASYDATALAMINPWKHQTLAVPLLRCVVVAVEPCFAAKSIVFGNAMLSFKGAARGGAEGAQAPPLSITILVFIFLIFHQH